MKGNFNLSMFLLLNTINESLQGLYFKFKMTSTQKYGKITLLSFFSILDFAILLVYIYMHKVFLNVHTCYQNCLNHHPQSYWYIHPYRNKVRYILNWNLHTCICPHKNFLQLHLINSRHVFDEFWPP